MLTEAGYIIEQVVPAHTRRYGGLDNADKRAEYEVVIVASRSPGRSGSSLRPSERRRRLAVAPTTTQALTGALSRSRTKVRQQRRLLTATGWWRNAGKLVAIWQIGYLEINRDVARRHGHSATSWRGGEDGRRGADLRGWMAADQKNWWDISNFRQFWILDFQFFGPPKLARNFYSEKNIIHLVRCFFVPETKSCQRKTKTSAPFTPIVPNVPRYRAGQAATSGIRNSRCLTEPATRTNVVLCLSNSRHSRAINTVPAAWKREPVVTIEQAFGANSPLVASPEQVEEQERQHADRLARETAHLDNVLAAMWSWLACGVGNAMGSSLRLVWSLHPTSPL